MARRGLSFLVFNLIVFTVVAQPNRKYGVLGQQAPKWEVDEWIDEYGNKTTPIEIDDYKGKIIYLLAFQSWCPGCHSRGFPTLKKVKEHFQENEDVVFFSVQTVFEGHHTNTFDKLRKTQLDYNLKIPFGHDNGNAYSRYPNLMRNYKTGGTPWVIIINKEGKVVFNNFHIDANQAIKVIEQISK